MVIDVSRDGSDLLSVAGGSNRAGGSRGRVGQEQRKLGAKARHRPSTVAVWPCRREHITWDLACSGKLHRRTYTLNCAPVQPLCAQHTQVCRLCVAMMPMTSSP